MGMVGFVVRSENCAELSESRENGKNRAIPPHDSFRGPQFRLQGTI